MAGFAILGTNRIFTVEMPQVSHGISSLKDFHDVLDRKLTFLHLDDKNREFKKGQQFAISWQKSAIFLKFTVSEIK